MTLEHSIEEQHRILAEFRAACSVNNHWNDDQRQRLDSRRIIALDDSAAQILHALKAANAQLRSAEALLRMN